SSVICHLLFVICYLLFPHQQGQRLRGRSPICHSSRGRTTPGNLYRPLSCPSRSSTEKLSENGVRRERRPADPPLVVSAPSCTWYRPSLRTRAGKRQRLT